MAQAARERSPVASYSQKVEVCGPGTAKPAEPGSANGKPCRFSVKDNTCQAKTLRVCGGHKPGTKASLTNSAKAAPAREPVRMSISTGLCQRGLGANQRPEQRGKLTVARAVAQAPRRAPSPSQCSLSYGLILADNKHVLVV